MGLIIDGYNVLNEAGILHPGVGLARARSALLNFIADSVDGEELPRTTVVFDAKDAPPGLPRQTIHRGITVRFAAEFDEADELIEELIRADSAPRQLVVVSSDRRIQRAARRRRAQAIASVAWYAQLVQKRRQPSTLQDLKPQLPLSEAEIQQWLAEFADAATETTTQADSEIPPKSQPPQKPSEPLADQIGNPFPPGYGEDLLDEE